MQQTEYYDNLLDAWRGELFGEALMSRLSRAEAAGSARSKGLAQIAMLERLMSEVLFRILPEGIDRSAFVDEAVSRAERELDAMRDYDVLVARINRGVPCARERYVLLAEAAPPEHCDIMNLLIEHEDALGTFFAAHDAGGPKTLDDVTNKLHHALDSR